MNTTSAKKTPLRRWATPLVAVVIGLAYLGAGLAGDDPGFGVFGLVLMVAVGALFVLLASRSETVAGLLDRRDERINGLDAQASLAAGMVMGLAIGVMFLVEVARGQDGSPYYQLGAIGGITYVVVLIALRIRR